MLSTLAHLTAHRLGPLCALGFGLLLAACTGAQNAAVKIKGSDTVLPIAQRLAEAYDSSAAQALDLSITGGGSGVGIAALLEGTTDIALSSRDIKFGERLRLASAHKPYREAIIAYDALAICVHPSNPIRQLTREQIEAIYTGQVRSWRELGGTDTPIVVYSRESSSGTHEFFKEAVLHDREFAPDVLMMPATGAIIQSVSQTPGAIGYVGLAYVNASVAPLSVSYDSGRSYVPPTLANASTRAYPIVRPLYFLYLESRAEHLRPFLDYAFSPEGQHQVALLGFPPAKAINPATAKPAQP